MSDVGKEAWPTRCAPLAQAFAVTVRDNDGSAELVTAAEKLGKALATETAFSTNIGPLVDDVFARARRASLDAERELEHQHRCARDGLTGRRFDHPRSALPGGVGDDDRTPRRRRRSRPINANARDEQAW